MSDNTIHIYCDESCHLEHDEAKAMVVGALWCPANKRKELSEKIKQLRNEHGLTYKNELKWVKISPVKEALYLKLIELFFSEIDLHYRAVVIPDKGILNHSAHGQTHDDFYYKTWYQCLTMIITEAFHYRIFLDIKDTKGSVKAKKLHDVLCNAHFDFNREIIESVELVHSHDLVLIQLADVLTGALAYFHRDLSSSKPKAATVQRIQQLSGHSLRRSTLPREEKFNVLVWKPE